MSRPSMSTMGEAAVGALGVEEEANILKSFIDDAKWQSSYQIWKGNKRGTLRSLAAAARHLKRQRGVNTSENNNEYNKIDIAAKGIEPGINGKPYSIPKICKEMSISLFEELKREAARAAGKGAIESMSAVGEAAANSAVSGRNNNSTRKYLGLRNLPRLKYTEPNLRRTLFGVGGITKLFEKKELTSIDIAIIKSKIDAYSLEIKVLRDSLKKMQTRCKQLKKENEVVCGLEAISQFNISIRETEVKKTALEDLLRSQGVSLGAAAGAGAEHGGKRKTIRNRRRRNQTRKNRA